MYLSSVQHSDSQFLRIIQDLSYFQKALICFVWLLILQSPCFILFWLRWRQEPQNRMVETGPGLWENRQKINQLSPLPSARRASEDPVSPVASVPATWCRSFRWGRHTWKASTLPSYPYWWAVLFSPVSYCLNMTHRKLPQNLVAYRNKCLFLTYVCVGWLVWAQLDVV